MPYGIIKVDQVTFTNAGVDQTISVSGIVASISGNITATGTISGNVIRGGTTVSGATVTGTAGQFGTITGNTAGFTTVTGTTVTGTTATFTSGVFTNISGGTHTITSGVFASGTAANPSITFQGDVNTGIYSPGADQVAISTNGSGRLFVDASGRIGVGRTPVAYGSYNVLDLAGSAGSIQKWVHTGSTVELQAYASSTLTAIGSATNHPFIIVTNDTERLRITSAGAFNFTGAGTAGVTQAVSFNGSAPVNSMVLDSSGRLGVGTSSPSTLLDLSSSTNTYQTIQSTNANSNALTYYKNSAAVSSGFYVGLNADEEAMLWQSENNAIRIGTNNAERIRIDSSGRVGIGTTSPTGLLTVAASAPAIDWTFASNTAFKHSIEGTGYATSPASGNHLAIKVASGSGTQATVMHLNGAGQVGIGTTSPGYLLTVSGGATSFAANQYVRFGAGLFASGDGSTDNYLFTGTNGLNIRNATDTSTLVKVDNSGRLLVGTSTSRDKWFNTAAWGNPTFQLETAVSVTSVASIVNNANDDGPGALFLAKSRAGSIGGVTVVNNNDVIGRISFQGADGAEMVAAAQIEAFVDGTPGANDMPGRLVFSTTADGASSPTERMRIRNDGAVWIGTTTGTINTTNYGTAIGFGAAGAFDTSRNVNGASAVASIFGNAGVAYVMGDGDLENTNNRYTGISDIKFKQNIVDASSQWSDIKQIRVRKYELIASPDRQHIGLIAQELEQICPGLVVEREDRDGESYKSVAYSVLYMKAVKALQEAMERIETLEAKVAALESA